MEAECRKVLYSIYELRKNETQPDKEEINSKFINFSNKETKFQSNFLFSFKSEIEFCLAMIHFLSKDYEKVNKYF